MIPTLILLVIIIVSLTAVRLGTSALMMTGLNFDTANFQSYSAFFGTGFTTKEAELVVNHPIRRRIIRDLIIVGNVGLTSTLATVIVTFVKADRVDNIPYILIWLSSGAIFLFLLLKLKIIQPIIDKCIQFSLKKIGLKYRLDYELLLRVQDGYCISEVEITDNHSYVNKSLGDTRPADRGIIILGIQHPNARYSGAPGPEAILRAGDIAMVYGKEKSIKKFCLTAQ